jgi:hypothetical protein
MIWLPGRDPRLRPSIRGQHPFQTRRLRAAVVCSLVLPKQPSYLRAAISGSAAHERQCSLIDASPTWD